MAAPSEPETRIPIPDTRPLPLDRWVARHPWHPRVLPFFVYIVFLAVIGFVDGSVPWLHPALYTVQCAVVAWLLWRYRKLTPELTVRFHWLAVPVGVFVCVAWIALGWLMAGEFGVRWEAITSGTPLPMVDYPDEAVPRFATDGSTYQTFFDTMGLHLGWTTLVLRLLGMSLLVPLFEELFIRSLMLRSLSDPRRTWLGLQQVLCDFPLVGEWFMHTAAGERASRAEPVFGAEFERTPLGKLTLFGVFASTLVFMLSHHMRDWPGIWMCGVSYCLVVWWTNRGSASDPSSALRSPPSLGLGPVVWAHGITNALLWAYTVWTGDWQFL